MEPTFRMTKSLLKLLIEGEKWDILASHYGFTPHFITFREKRYFNYRSAPAEMMRCLLDRAHVPSPKTPKQPKKEKVIVSTKPQWTKKALFEKQNGHCFYCGIREEFDKFTKDHKVPISKGGRAGANLVLACGRCNSAKGSMSIDEFVQSKWLGDKIRQVTGNNAKRPVNEI
jgi:5-methylcytosine-specific restriction endonuclease McrA